MGNTDLFTKKGKNTMAILNNEKELIIKAQAGSKEARDILFIQYYRLCKKVWGKETAEGFIRFCEILKNFDTSKYVKTTSFYTFLLSSWKFHLWNFNKAETGDFPVEQWREQQTIQIQKKSERIPDKIAEGKSFRIKYKATLTETEDKFFKLLLKGFSTKEIRKILGLENKQHVFIQNQLKRKIEAQFIS